MTGSGILSNPFKASYDVSVIQKAVSTKFQVPGTGEAFSRTNEFEKSRQDILP